MTDERHTIRLAADARFVAFEFDDGVSADADDASLEELETAAGIYDALARDDDGPTLCFAWVMDFPETTPNAEGLVGIRGEPISEADYDELTPTQLAGLRVLNKNRSPPAGHDGPTLCFGGTRVQGGGR